MPVRIVAAVYIAGVLGLTLFPFHIMYGKWADGAMWYDQINWLFLVTLDPSAIPNTMLTVPLGMLLPLIFPKATSTRRAVAYGAILSLAIEVSQVLCVALFNNYRQADVNDLLVNTLGCVLGYWIVRLAVRISVAGCMLRRLALPGSALAPAPQDVGAATGDRGVGAMA
ncbi:VanZ family protein [Streptomyces sp. NPDC005262]|uniref:VanZ family protein n=1 Tax=Streptomyces sp. NPDC005262 TaxID=3364710 RepID=UPI0036B3F3F6